MTTRGRKLAPDEAALWSRVIASVRPLQSSSSLRGEAGAGHGSSGEPAPIPRETPSPPARQAPPGRADARTHLNAAQKRQTPDTLDGGWDRRLSRGLVAPESTIDLHGHSLATAHARLDRGLAHAIARGDRILLLVTGKPPAPESERPHARGAIRAAVGDWLGSSRHADRIAAVRGAHPRHGGSGALYIILRRTKSADSRIS
jgi:DNA-nicking Smr family endonuclease